MYVCSPKVIHTGKLRVCLEVNDQQCCRNCVHGQILRPLLSYCRKAVNYYELLGLKSNASLEEIKNAFFEKSKKVWPSPRQRRAALFLISTVDSLNVCFHAVASSVNN